MKPLAGPERPEAGREKRSRREPDPVRALLVSRHRMLAETVERALRRRTRVRVDATAHRLDEALRVLDARWIDLVLLDASIEEEESIELTCGLTDRFPKVTIVPFGVSSTERMVAFVEAGAGHCLPRGASLEDLVAVVAGLRLGLTLCPLGLVARVAERIEALARQGAAPETCAAPPELSEREHDVLRLVARGLSNKEVAHSLDIRTSTVKNHVHSILSKLGVEGRREAVRMAYETALLRGPLRWGDLDRDGY